MRTCWRSRFTTKVSWLSFLRTIRHIHRRASGGKTYSDRRSGLSETHTDLILFSQQKCLRPIVDPVPRRTISLVVRSDYIHEAKLNAVIDAVKHVIPGRLLDNVVRKEHLSL